MAWTDDLETVVSRTGVERYRWLTSDQNPDVMGRERYRAQMAEMATGAEPVRHTAYPSVRHQARNLWRSVKAFVASGGKLAPKAVRAERQRTCAVCPYWTGARCRKCGCATPIKIYSAAEVCPDDPPRWGPYEGKS
jgi:hypothetical protein